ncbi:MAG: pseudouridine synthase [Pseudomonadota bacterium]
MSADKHKDTEITSGTAGGDVGGERIAKRMARAGLCSRREAERWIEDGRVMVNGAILDTPATIVSAADEIVVDGKPLPKEERTRLFLYHKPPGLVTTHKDEQGRATVFEELPTGLPRVISIGRLDLNTEGLLLLTNDGELSRFLELPETGWTRKYRVRVHGRVDESRLDSLRKGITVEGIHYKSIEAKLDSTHGSNSWLSVALREGKNREIRRVMDALGLSVNRLIRTDYGPFALGKLPVGAVKEIEEPVLKQQVAKFFKS